MGDIEGTLVGASNGFRVGVARGNGLCVGDGTDVGDPAGTVGCVVGDGV